MKLKIVFLKLNMKVRCKHSQTTGYDACSYRFKPQHDAIKILLRISPIVSTAYLAIVGLTSYSTGGDVHNT